MAISLFRRQTIERIVAESGGAICHYCKTECRLSFSNKFKNSATIDHKIPKSKGGTNAPENLVLACNGCNNLKGNRSYDDFIANPRPKIVPKPVVTVAAKASAKFAKKKVYVHPAYKVVNGTLAAAIERGDVGPNGLYKKPKCEINPEPRNRIKAIPYHETMYILTGKRVPKRSEFFDAR